MLSVSAVLALLAISEATIISPAPVPKVSVAVAERPAVRSRPGATGRVCLPGNPLCPPPDVTITPGGGTYTTASQSVTIDWCGHANLSGHQVLLNGVDVTSSFSYTSSAKSGCSSHASSTGTINLAGGANTLTASADDVLDQNGSSSASYTLNAPTLSLTPQPIDRIDAVGCAAECFESTLSYSTPAYVSMGVPRSVSLQYRSGRAHPLGKVELDATNLGGPAGTRIALQLMAQNGSLVALVNGATTAYFTPAPGGTTRLAAEFDASSFATGRYTYTANVQYLNADGSAQGPAVSVGVGVIIVNEQNSPYGAGVTIAGVQRLYVNPDGVGAVVTDGLGGAAYFSGPCQVTTPCTYSSPVGDFSTLSTDGTNYLRRYPDGTVIGFTISGYHGATIDRFGNVTQYRYDCNSPYGQCVVASITDPSGQVVTLWYRDANSTYGGTYRTGSLGSITSLGGRAASFGVDASNNLIHWMDVDGVYYGVASYDAHRLKHLVDRAGQGWDYDYANANAAHVATITAPAVTTISGTVRPVVTLGEPSGAILRYLGNGGGTSGNPVPANLDTRAVVTDAGGHATTFSVNQWGQPLATTDALNRTTTVTRDSDGRPTQVQHPTGAVDVFRYAGSSLVMARPAGKDSTNYRWSTNAAGVVLLDSIWGPRQSFQKFSYLSNGAVQSTTTRYSQSDATSFPTQYTTDAYGRPLTATDPSLHVTRYTYTGRYGNPDSVVMAAGQWTNTIYDVFGRDSVQKALGMPAAVTTLYDAINRVTTVNDGTHAQPFRYHYGVVNLDSITDPQGQVFRHSVNGLGWTTAEPDVDPTKGQITFNYDVEGQVRSWTNRRGQTINLTYDAAHRVTSRVGATMADYFGYSADDRSMAAWNAVSVDSLFFAANGWTDSSVTRIAGQRFRQQFLPDVGQRLDSVDIAMAGGAIAFAGRKYLYDPTKNTPTTIRVNGVAGASFDYDGEMFLSGIRYQMPVSQVYTFPLTTSATRTLLYTSTHQVYGDEINLYASYGSQYFSQYVAYDSLGRLRESSTYGAAYPYKSFTYSPTGQLAERARYVTASAGACPIDPNYGQSCASKFNTAGTYEKDVLTFDDALNRRFDVNSGRSASGSTWSSTTELAYNTGDRINALTPLGGTMNGMTLNPDPAYAAYFERDGDGNVTRRYNNAGTDVRYGWDEQGRLTSVTVPGTGGTIGYDYNAFGQLVRRRTNGTVDRHFLWSDDDLLAELDGAATARIGEYVYWSTDHPMAMVTGASSVANIDYFLQDQIGNVRNAFRYANNAPITFGSDYTEWGLLRDTLAVSSPNRMRFKGMIWMGDSTQLYYARNRWYSPQIGGFMSEDPLGPAGGANTYAFADNDPINGSDPYGLCPACKGWDTYGGGMGTLGDFRHPGGTGPGQQTAASTGPVLGCTNRLAQGLDGLTCAMQDLIGAIKAGPGILANAIFGPSLKKDLVVGVAMAPFLVAGGGEEEVLFQGGKAGLRTAIRTGTVEGVSGSQGLSLLARLKKGPVDAVEIIAVEGGSIRAAFYRQLENLTEVTTRVYNRAGEQTEVWIRRFNSAGREVY